MDMAQEHLERVLEIQAKLQGKPAAIDTRHIRRADGSVNTEYYFAAVEAAIAEGICPWCGSQLDALLCCRHPSHSQSGLGGIQWTRDGMTMDLPEPPRFECMERFNRLPEDEALFGAKGKSISPDLLKALEQYGRYQ